MKALKTDVSVFILTLAFICSIFVYTEACSCMPAHPQQHYCSSDFVILARVKRETAHNYTRVYKVRVRKYYKISEKGELALKSGRLITPLHGATCGIQLRLGKLYVLSGSIYSLKAHINLCNMAAEWNTFTRRQRKGLKLLYKQGCTCDVHRCMYGRRCYRHMDACNWNSECETKEGICLRQANKSCMWTRNRALGRCLKEERSNYTTVNGNHRLDKKLQYHLP